MAATADRRGFGGAALALAAMAAAVAPAAAQLDARPVLRVAFADGPSRGGVPALAWLCEQFLPGLAQWPAELDPRQGYALTLSPAGLRIAATTVQVPASAVAVGSLVLEGDAELLWRCERSGLEQWFVPSEFVLPARWRALLEGLDATAVDAPHTLSVSVLAGHLAGGLVDGDPRATLLRLGAAQCGDATWTTWRNGDQLRVRGRSDGGLMLPLALCALAAVDGSGAPSSLQLRAFAARDADRAEAARQLGRGDREPDLTTLRALLAGEDQVRLTAIDALVRRGAADELPRIVAAAGSDEPWATIAASDAVRSLWLLASPEVRQATRAAIARSECVPLRAIDLDALTPGGTASAGSDGAAARARVLVVLGILASGLYWLWQRARRLAVAPAC